MGELFIILLIAVSVLLIVQIVALFRIRYLTRQLRYTLHTMRQAFGFLQKSELPAEVRRCQFCKYRKTYMKNNYSGQGSAFYYRCGLDEHPIRLDHTCKQFEPESFYFDKKEPR